jgi:hypothetical protein
MATEKLVDGDFLAKLVDGSYETAVGAVDEAVMANAELFGGDSETVRTLATYPDHMIVANQDGEFFRGQWSLDEDGEIVLSDIQDIDVPVYEADVMGTQVRDEALAATKELMAGGVPEDRLRSLYRLVKSGVRLTAEGVEDLFNKQSWFEEDWFKAIEEKKTDIRAFLGGEAARLEHSRPQFETLIGGNIDEDQAENHRAGVIAALKRLRAEYLKMRQQTALARQVTENHQLRDGSGDGMTASDFVQFVHGFTEDLDGVLGILSDAVAVSENGCVKCLARIHDGIADQAYEWTLAAAFSEKLARRFEPVAA